MIINICMISDNNYALYTGIALTSLKVNRILDIHYKVFILSDGIKNENKNKLKELTDKKFDINIIDVNGYEEFKKNLEIKHISARPSSLYKFRIAEILEGLDKVLYVDGDVLFMKDISGLYETNFGNNYAAVTPESYSEGNNVPRSCQRIGINNNIYFNSGLMLLNLKQLRENKIAEKLLEYRVKGKNFLMDQDAFNAVIGKNVIYFPTWYFTSYYELEDKKNYIKYNEKSKRKIINKTVILHLATKKKPWIIKQPWITKKYLSYHAKSPFRGDTICPINYKTQILWKIIEETEDTWFHNFYRKVKKKG